MVRSKKMKSEEELRHVFGENENVSRRLVVGTVCRRPFPSTFSTKRTIPVPSYVIRRHEVFRRNQLILHFTS